MYMLHGSKVKDLTSNVQVETLCYTSTFSYPDDG